MQFKYLISVTDRRLTRSCRTHLCVPPCPVHLVTVGREPSTSRHMFFSMRKPPPSSSYHFCNRGNTNKMGHTWYMPMPSQNTYETVQDINSPNILCHIKSRDIGLHNQIVHAILFCVWTVKYHFTLYILHNIIVNLHKFLTFINNCKCCQIEINSNLNSFNNDLISWKWYTKV